MACKELLGKQKIDSRYVKAIANHYYCNLHGLKTRLLDRIQVIIIIVHNNCIWTSSVNLKSSFVTDETTVDLEMKVKDENASKQL